MMVGKPLGESFSVVTTFIQTHPYGEEHYSFPVRALQKRANSRQAVGHNIFHKLISRPLLRVAHASCIIHITMIVGS